MNAKPFHWIPATTSSGSLSSVDRINEVLFGLIMVLTFTCSISAATAGHEELSTILWSALGCNIAWGFVDALMYLFSVLLERGETFASVRIIRSAATEADAIKAIQDVVPSFIAHAIREEHMAGIAGEIRKLPEPPQKVVLTFGDLRQALAIFLLVFLSTFPVTLPFMLIHHVPVAIRVSNIVALVLLFLTGVYLAGKTGRSSLVTGLAFAVIGTVLVTVTMALGG